MLYIFGVCERCKEPIELKVSYIAIEKDADVSVRLALIHKPNSINKTICGGRIHVLTVTETQDEDIRTVLPIELLQALYEEGMSLRELACLATTNHMSIKRMLSSSTAMRRVGRPSKREGNDDN